MVRLDHRTLNLQVHSERSPPVEICQEFSALVEKSKLSLNLQQFKLSQMNLGAEVNLTLRPLKSGLVAKNIVSKQLTFQAFLRRVQPCQHRSSPLGRPRPLLPELQGCSCTFPPDWDLTHSVTNLTTRRACFFSQHFQPLPVAYFSSLLLCLLCK